MLSIGFLSGRHNRHELVGIEGCAADQRAVYVGLGYELGYVGGVDAAAVLDADLVGHHLAVHLANEPPDLGDYYVRACSGGGTTCADGPDRLVGDYALERLLHREAIESGGDLPLYHAEGLARLVLSKVLADANYGRDAVPKGGFDLLAHVLVRFVEILPALGMAQDDVSAPALDHERGDLAGVRSFVLPEHVLRAQEEGCAVEQVGEGLDGSEGRADHHVHALDHVKVFEHGIHKLERLIGGLVHLPVTGDDGSSH